MAAIRSTSSGSEGGPGGSEGVDTAGQQSIGLADRPTDRGGLPACGTARVIWSKGDAADETNETMSVTTFGLTSLVVAAGDGPGG